MDKQKIKLLRELFKNQKIVSRSDHLSAEITLANITSVLYLKPNFSSVNPLTVREMSCFILLVSGSNPDQCADVLEISVESVHTYEKRIRKKLGAHNRAHAFYLAFLRGYLSF